MSFPLNKILMSSAAALSVAAHSLGAQAAVDPADMEFMKKAAIAGQFEIKSSEVALTRGGTPAVKDFAGMMVKDHGAAAAELSALAAKKGVALPKDLDAEHAKNLGALQKTKTGKDFDEKYADLMEDGHDDAVKLFATAADSAKDPEVKAYAQKTLPTLKMHSEHAEKLDMRNVAP